MPTFRDFRRVVFRKLKVTPKRLAEPAEQRVERALSRIRATPEEAKAILAFAKIAEARLEQKKLVKARGGIEEDAIFISLRERTHRLLGKERAEEFFDLCNDPYF